MSVIHPMSNCDIHANAIGLQIQKPSQTSKFDQLDSSVVYQTPSLAFEIPHKIYKKLAFTQTIIWGYTKAKPIM